MRLVFGLILLVTAVSSQDFRVQLPRPSSPGQPIPARVRPFQPGLPRQPIPGQPMRINSQVENPDIPENAEGLKRIRPVTFRKVSRIPVVPTSTESYGEEEEPDKDESPNVEVTPAPVNEFLKLTKNLKFDCSEYPPGFYANVETDCRIWHMCYGAVRYDSMCPNLTRFHQEYRTCAHEKDVDCAESPKFFDMNKNLYTQLKPTTAVPMRKKVRRRRTTTPAPSQDYMTEFDSSQMPIADSQQFQQK